MLVNYRPERKRNETTYFCMRQSLQMLLVHLGMCVSSVGTGDIVVLSHFALCQ